MAVNYPRIFLFLILGVWLWGCGAAKPLSDLPPQPGKMMPGPGLFTGKEGKFILKGN